MGTLQAIRQLQCGFSGSSPMVCCPPSLPRKAVTSNDNPAVDVNVNSRTNLDIGGLNARSGNFPVSQEDTTLWSEDFRQELSFVQDDKRLSFEKTKAAEAFVFFCLSH